MLRKLSINSIISLINFILIIILLTFYILFFYVFSDNINSLTNAKNYDILNIKQYIIIGLAVSLIIHVLSFIFIISYKNILKQKDREIGIQQAEIKRQKELIENITSLYDDTLENEKFKTEFFSSVSHELKTPISIILGAIKLIDQSKSDHITEEKKAAKHFEAIKHNCYRLLRLINNILDITKIDSGFINIYPVNCNIVYLIEEITQSVAPYARNKNITLEFDTEDEEIFTAVDIDKIERIILNLLSNAIKFTPFGGIIKVNVGIAGDKVYISIKDTGLGIPQNKQSTIFERFKQVNSSLTREFEGSGIGLSLVKSFVSLHEGDIKLISEENKGSEFIIELPICSCEYNKMDNTYINNSQDKIIDAINIEFSDIYSISC